MNELRILLATLKRPNVFLGLTLTCVGIYFLNYSLVYRILSLANCSWGPGELNQVMAVGLGVKFGAITSGIGLSVLAFGAPRKSSQ